MAGYILYKGPKSLLNKICAILITSFAIWNIVDIFSPSQDITSDTAILFQNISSIGWISFASVILSFSLVFSKKEKLLMNRWFLIFLFLFPTIFIYKQLTNGITGLPVQGVYGWEFNWQDTIWSYLFFAYYITFTLTSIYIIYLHGKKTKKILEKNQSKIIVATVIISLIAGTTTDVILPLFHFNGIPQLGNVILLVFAGGMIYAILKYKFLTFTPALAAENIISTMGELCILMDKDGKILNINNAVLETLKYEQKELTGKSAEIIFMQSNLINSLLEKNTRGENIKNIETVFLTKESKEIPVIFSCSYLKDKAGDIGGIVFVATDITERKQADEILRKSEKMLKEAQEMAHLGFWRWDIKTGDVEWSDEVYKIFCLDPEKFTPKIDSIQALSPWPEDHQRDKELISRAIESQTPGSYEQKFLRPDQSIGYYYSTFQGNYDENGNLYSIIGTVLDITERKKVENALRESKEKFQNLVETTNDIIWETNKDSMFTYISPRVLAVLGYAPEELIGRSPFDFMPPDEAKKINKRSEEIVASKKSYDALVNINLHKDGHLVAFETSGVPFLDTDNNLLGYRGIDRDITERKLAEEAVQKSEANLVESMRIAKLGSWEYDVNRDQFIFNDQFYSLFHTTAEREGGYTMSSAQYAQKFVYPDDMALVGMEIQKALDTTDPDYYAQVDHRIICADGETGHITVHIRIEKDANGHTVKTLGVNQDITERKKAEELIKRSAEKWQTTFNSITDIITVISKDHEFLEINKAGCDSMGMNREDIIGKKCYKLVHGTHNPLKGCPCLITLKTMEAATNEIFENDRYYQVSAWPIFDENNEVIAFSHSVRDITERKLVDEKIKNLNATLELRIAERTTQLEAANKEQEAFSYSVSHDLRAPLRRVHGFTQILQEDYADKFDEDGQKLCLSITENTKKMGTLIDDLLAFAQLSHTDMQRSVINMKELINAVYLDITDAKSRERITLSIGEICNVAVDSTMIKHVWTNLLSNAVKYSSKKERAIISISCKNENGQCIYCIKDNGVGFDMNYVNKLFGVFERLHSENDFDGTGVGLAIVKRIIQRHGGKVWAESAVGKGASFYFSLPV
jgi:PAS domain S-box-containing protein